MINFFESPAPSLSMYTKQNATILVVDDHEDDRHLFKAILCKRGFTVIEADSGEKALQLVRQNPDLVILDICMPVMTGFEICRRIKNDPSISSIPVIQCSAIYIQSGDKIHGLESGADYYLTKPFNANELIAVITSLLRIHEAEEAAKKSVKQLLTMFDSMSEGIFLLSMDERIINYNKKGSDLLNKPAAEIIESRLCSALTGSSEHALNCPFNRMMTSNKREASEFYYDAKWYQLNIDPIWIEGERVTSAVARLVDVTEKKNTDHALHEANDRFRGVLENLPIMFQAFDTNGNIEFWNNECEKVLGFKSQEVIGKSDAMELFYPDQSYRQIMLSKMMEQSEGSFACESEISCKNGEKKSITWINTPESHFISKPTILSIGRDDTDRKVLLKTLTRTLDAQKIINEMTQLYNNINPDQLDAVINQVLEKIGTFANSERSYVFLFDHINHSMTKTHGWCSTGIEQQTGLPRSFSTETCSRLIHQLEQFTTIHIPHVQDSVDLTPVDHGLFTSHGIQSILLAPMSFRNYLVGFVGFDSVQGKRTWEDQDISLLKTTAEIFSSALMHSQLEIALQKISEEDQHVFENIKSTNVIEEKNENYFGVKTGNGELHSYHRSELPIMSILRNPPLYNFEDSKSKQDEEKHIWLKEKYEFILDMLGQGILCHGKDDKIHYANKSAEIIFGQSRESLLGENIRNLSFSTVHEDGSMMTLDEHPSIAAMNGGQSVYNVILGMNGSASGDHKWLAVSSIPIFRNNETQPYKVYSIFEDITNYKRNEDRYKVVSSIAIDGFLICDMKGHVADVNDAYCRMSGYSKEEILQLNIADLDALNSPDEIVQRLQRIRISHFESFETMHKGKDGSIFNVEIRMSFESRDGGYFYALLRDITETKLNINKVFLNEERYKFIEEIPFIFLTVNVGGKILYINKCGAEQLGYSTNEITGKPIISFIVEEDRTFFQEQLVNCLRSSLTCYHFDVRKLRKDRTFIWIKVRISATKDGNGDPILLLMCNDITHDKKSDELNSLLMNTISSSVLLIDRQTRVVMVNNSFLQKSRFPIVDAIGVKLQDIFPEGIMQEMDLDKLVTKVFETKQPVLGERLTYRAPNTPYSIYYYSIIPILWGEEVENVMIIMDDISEQIRLSEEVHRIECHLARVVESASDIVLSTNLQGRILTWNAAAERTSGYSLDEVEGKYFLDYCSGNSYDWIKRSFSVIQDSIAGSETIESNLVTKTGKLVSVSWVFSSMKNDRNSIIGFVAVGRDLTERQKYEQQILNAQKLAALGVMAGGIAHEIRNPLAICSSAAQFLCEDTIDNEFRKDCVRKIETSIYRMSNIIENLLRFARPSGKNEIKRVELVPIINDTILLVQNKATIQNVKIITQYPAESITIYGNMNLFEHVFVNLFLNAIAAMPEGGTLTVKVEKIENNVFIYIIDTGYGIPQENLSKIFDPFYTTGAKGIGLGLSICHSIIKQYSGSIDVESTSGKGSTFIMRLPLSF